METIDLLYDILDIVKMVTIPVYIIFMIVLYKNR